MNAVKVELWMWMGEELGGDFKSPTEMRSQLEIETAEGLTVRGLLARLAGEYPAFAERVYDPENRKLRSTVVMIFNDRAVSHSKTYDLRLKDGDEIRIVPVHAGG